MLPERHYGRRRGRNVSRETFRPSKKLPYFLSHKKIPMGCSLNHPIPLQKRLSVQKLFPEASTEKPGNSQAMILANQTSAPVSQKRIG